ncbi:MAG: hypothetical protein GXO32_04760 [Crenarchaeota archaeon]|nr:hypothetical protein [Thermoproteota archaeon]
MCGIEARSISICLRIVEKTMRGLDWRLSYVAARCVHATGDPTLPRYIRFSKGLEHEIQSVCSSVKRVVADVEMVGSGIAHRCRSAGLDLLVAIRFATSRVSRVASGLRELVARGLIDGSTVLVNGNSPSFLEVALDAAEKGLARPRLVIATPPGFIKAPRTKARLLRSGLPYIAVVGSRGGSPVAAAAFNAIMDICSGRARTLVEIAKRLGKEP